MDNIINSTVVPTGETVVLLSDLLAEQELKGARVRRLIIDVDARLATIGTGGVLGIGICMVDNDGAGAGAVPNPADSGEQPGWLWRDSKGISSSDLNDNAQAVKFKADLKVNRRFLGGDMNLALILELGASTSNVNLDGLIRAVIGLH